jgi:hypothetical protein
MNTTTSLASAAYYLVPTLIAVSLTYLTALLVLVSRVADLLSGDRTMAFYENYSGLGGTGFVQRSSNQLKNLFEFPVLFFALMAFCVASNLRDPMLLSLAWIFALGRIAHWVVHLAFNRLWLRTPVFMISNLVLLAMWIRFVVIVVGSR